jgi:Protein of unknown function (DUF1579)
LAKTICMKRIALLLSSATLLLLSCNSGDEKTNTGTPAAEAKTETAEAKKDAPAGPPDSAQMAAMTKAWMDFATPGAEHAWMAKQSGTWTCDSVKQWMDPAQPPTINKATEKISMGLNGLYQMTDFSTNMMGAPMQGHGILGFDKMKNKFVLSWIDNMGSGIVRMEGTYNEGKKMLSMAGKQSDPYTKAETDMRQELTFIDDNSYTMSMYGAGHDGKEAKFMEGTFKRKK